MHNPLPLAHPMPSTPGYFHQQDITVFESTMRLNYLGVVASVQSLYPRMVQRNSGHICLVSSVMGTMGQLNLICITLTNVACALFCSQLLSTQVTLHSITVINNRFCWLRSIRGIQVRCAGHGGLLTQ